MTKIKNVSKKQLLIAALVLLVIAGAAAYFLTKSDKDASNQSAQSSGQNQDQNEENGINYGPPTAEEQKEADDNKQRILNEQQTQTPAGQKRAVTPLITFAEQNGQDVEVGSYVPGIFEDGGVCTAQFTKGSRKATKNVTAVKEGNATHCPLLTAAVAELGETGEWSVSVSYLSSAASGTSEIKKLEVK